VLVAKNMNWNWKGIIKIKNYVYVFTIVRKHSPFIQKRSFCASFTIKSIIQKLLYQGYKWKKNGC
jgi:hypothetical protein